MRRGEADKKKRKWLRQEGRKWIKRKVVKEKQERKRSVGKFVVFSISLKRNKESAVVSILPAVDKESFQAS